MSIQQINVLRLNQIERKIKENQSKVNEIFPANLNKNFANINLDDLRFLIDEVKNLHNCLKYKDEDTVEFAEEFLKSSIGSIEWEDLRQKAKNILKKRYNV